MVFIQSKILPVADEFEKLIHINSDIIAVAQELKSCDTATLDMDNNQVISNKRNGKYSYKKALCYRPFNVYWAEQDLMMLSEFSGGNVPPGFEHKRLLQQSVSLLLASVDQINVRSDTAGYQHELLAYLDSGESRFGKIGFIVSCDVTKSFRCAVQEVAESCW